MFVWGGTVRSGLGFGGAALTLPLLLLIVDNPVIFLPIIGIQLVIFGLVTIGVRPTHVDYAYLARSLVIILPFKFVGVFGLLSLPANVLTAMVYAITLFYAIGYLTGIQIQSRSRISDSILLAAGGYVSGTSLIGAPLIIAVYVKYVARENLRETLFVLWIILVVIKLAAFVGTGTNLQLVHQLWLFPCALIGHLLGLRPHHHLQQARPETFMRVIGLALLVITVIGITVNFIVA